MPDVPDDLHSVAPAAALALEQIVDEYDIDGDIEHRQYDGFDKRVLSWQADDEVNRAVILTVVRDTEAVEDPSQPVLSVEFSAWIGPDDGSATATYRGSIADVHHSAATGVAIEAVEAAFNAVWHLSEGELDPVSEFL